VSQDLHALVVIGTGMMGSSVASAAKKRGVARQIIGIDAQAAPAAKALGLIDHAFESIAAAIAHLKTLGRESSTGVLIAAPVKAYSEIFSQLPALHTEAPLAWVSDIGSTKAGVVSASKALGALASQFVSSHPMAGSERQGVQAANADLFEGARVLISPLRDSNHAAIESVEEFWLGLGADPTPLPIEDHDALLAAISHLPHMLAYSLAGSLAQGHLAGAAQALHGGGLRDTTRIAASSPELWADIFLDNREALLQSCGEWSLQLQALRQAIEANDRELLLQLLTQAAQWRKGLQ
jgi:cyclohexadieny/prephenate dehydrogenase / 3-phosphoshikimate 1-carboxyvinyltransferase